MKVGIALNMLQKEGRSDADVFAEHLALGDLAEPLGFDSLFALEHHFTGYAMSPSPTQLLSYFAGRTKRLKSNPSSRNAATNTFWRSIRSRSELAAPFRKRAPIH